MTIGTETRQGERKITPVTCFTGFLGAGKTTTILGLLKQLPKNYKVVLVKNEYGDVEVDSLLASQSNITGVSEILNGCLCCTMVGLVENALEEIKEKMNPDRIIIESSGSAFPATLALRIRELEPKGFKLDGVVTVIDCVNFRGYEDTSPSAKLQAQYTDLLLLSKHQLLSEPDMDTLHDHLSTLNEDTPRIKVSSENPITPDLVFGLDTQLFSRQGEEGVDWEKLAGGAGWHGDEVETKTIWRGGRRPGSGKGKAGHNHKNGDSCDTCGEDEDEAEIDGQVTPISKETLETALSKLSFEIYRVKGIVRISSPMTTLPYVTHVLNYAFGRHELTPMPELDEKEEFKGVGLRLTVMGERGEVARRSRRLAESLGDSVQVA